MRGFEPPLVGWGIRNRNYSFEILRATWECVISIPTVEPAETVVALRERLRLAGGQIQGLWAYARGRRVWLNVKFCADAMNLLGESGVYNPASGEVTHDAEGKIYAIHPGLETNLADALGFLPRPSLHFGLNNRTYEDNRIDLRRELHLRLAWLPGQRFVHRHEHRKVIHG